LRLFHHLRDAERVVWGDQQVGTIDYETLTEQSGLKRGGVLSE
jgi:hypothetical protein